MVKVQNIFFCGKERNAINYQKRLQTLTSNIYDSRRSRAYQLSSSTGETGVRELWRCLVGPAGKPINKRQFQVNSMGFDQWNRLRSKSQKKKTEPGLACTQMISSPVRPTDRSEVNPNRGPSPTTYRATACVQLTPRLGDIEPSPEEN
jgi:hypothetical protein